MNNKSINTICTGTGRLLVFVFGLFLFSGAFTSCVEHIKTTMYQIEIGMEDFTQPQNISDPRIRGAFDQIISEFEKANFGLDSWTVEIVNDQFEAEDRIAENKYNNTLTRVKACELQCREIIDALGTDSESSFYIKVYCKLSRWVAADRLSTLMQEYCFELKYN